LSVDLVRRRIALSPLALGLAWSAASAAHAAALPAAQSLATELAQALRAGKPLLVMASLDGCPFCRLVRDNYLAPLLREGAVAVVQLDMQSAHAVNGFDGASSTHQDMLRAWSVKVAPTVLFFGKGAREAAPRLEGASIPDFYGAYLDERLRTARRAVG
jgi:thioredoxin-related protein